MTWRTVGNAGWLLAYVVWMTALIGGLVATRPTLLRSFGTPAAQADWDQFVSEAKRQAAGEGPVARRVPRSAEPPTLVLMRDYFATCLAGAALFGTLLFVAFMVLGRGAFAKSPRGSPPVEPRAVSQ